MSDVLVHPDQGQLALDTRLPAPKLSHADAADLWLAADPERYRLIVGQLRSDVLNGYRPSVKGAFHDLRKKHGGHWNNNHCARIGEVIAEREPDLAPLLQRRAA